VPAAAKLFVEVGGEVRFDVATVALKGEYNLIAVRRAAEAAAAGRRAS
jgi:hypothetical protein